MFDFITVACAVPDVGVANVEFNTQKITEKLDEAKDTAASLICFPELAVTGYTCQDLFNQKTLLDEAASAIGKIARKSREVKAAVVVGAPARLNGQLYNCAFVISQGEVLGIVPKTFLPVTGEFYEKRWFCSGAECDVKEASLRELGISDSERAVPVGTDLIFDLGDGIRLGIEICEDLWTPLAPSTFSALKGANLIVNISASNETISKRQYRRQLVCQQSASLLCGYVYVSAGMKESTTDLIFSGHSLVCENGIITAENTDYIDSDYLLLADIDMGRLFYDRQKNKSFHDCAALYAGQLSYRTVAVKGAESRSDAQYYKVSRL
ncbi:MAG: nitrilase-related carbon-nitrogen hydrolase, partial [Acutalibacteraceae bacterium]